MLQVKNQSRFAPAIQVLPDPDGIDTLFVVARGTFVLAPATAPAFLPAQAPPLAGDQYWGAPGASSLRGASEVHVGKIGTDVALIGSAWAAAERPVAEMHVGLSVAGRAKVIRVAGDRVWLSHGDGFTAPRPFTSMPLVHERAFGGGAIVHERAFGGGAIEGDAAGAVDERNPVGRGFRGRRPARAAEGQALPNLEDPRWPLRRFGDMPPPAAFGFIAPGWLPRRRYAGTYDQEWKRTQAPFLPRDYDRRFSNAAGADLVFDPPLRGGEAVDLDGVCRGGRLRLALPVVRPKIQIWMAGTWQRPPATLETVLFEPDEARVSLSWRAALRCDKRPLRVEAVSITEEGGPCPAPSS
jgi:hypothetical protein